MSTKALRSTCGGRSKGPVTISDRILFAFVFSFPLLSLLFFLRLSSRHLGDPSVTPRHCRCIPRICTFHLPAPTVEDPSWKDKLDTYRLVVLGLGDPHLLEGRQRGQDGTTDPDRVLALGGRNDLPVSSTLDISDASSTHLDLHRRRRERSDLLLHTVGKTAVHGGTALGISRVHEQYSVRFERFHCKSSRALVLCTRVALAASALTDMTMLP